MAFFISGFCIKSIFLFIQHSDQMEFSYPWIMKEKLQQFWAAFNFSSEVSVVVSAICYIMAIVILIYVLR